MKFKETILFLLLGFTVSGCTGDYRGKVVDAETDKPVEGAVVLVEWVAVKGMPGMTHSESVKVIETVTDKKGNFIIAGASDDTPHVTVYKKGYVAWNSKYIFPDYKKRTDFKWKSGHVYRLKRFGKGYSYIDHESYITSSINVSLGAEKKQNFLKKYRSAEENLVIEERNLKNK